MNELDSETQLVFPFLDKQPPEPDVLAGEIGGQTGYVEAEQFLLDLQDLNIIIQDVKVENKKYE